MRDRQIIKARLNHLFWNTAPAQRNLRQAGGYIARRLLTTGDPEGMAWGSQQLTVEDWRHAATTRGISPRERALALNLAGQRSVKLNIEQPTVIAGISVLGLSDILAMKVKVIGDRGELRDYFDLKHIEQLTGGVPGPKPSPSRITARLKAAARKLGGPSDRSFYGAGLLEVAAATAR